MNIAYEKKEQYFLFFIFLAALLVRIIYIFQVLKFPLTEYLVSSSTFDQYGFDVRAASIASGNWLGDTEVFGKEPLYSYFLAIIYRIFGYSHITVYILQSLLSSVGVLLLYRITSQLFNRSTAFIASFILAFYSVSIFYDALLLRASLLTFLNILLFYLLLRAQENKKAFLWFVSGAVLGLSVLTRHNILLPFIVVFILFAVKPFKIAAKSALAFIAGASVIILPVLARNYIISDYKKIAISSEINAFWVGNTHNSSGVDVVWSPEYHELNQKSGRGIRKTAQVFLDEIKKRPAEYLRLYARKTWMFFNAYEAPSNTNYYLYREEFPAVLRWPLFSFLSVCALGIPGVLLTFFRKKKPYLAYIFLMILSGSVILFHIQSRFRLPVIPFFIIFTSYSIYFIFDKLKNRDFAKPVAVAVVTVLLYVILKPDLTYAGFRQKDDIIRPLDRTNLALAYIDNYKKYRNRGVLDRALKQCNLAIEKEGSSYVPYTIKAEIYFLQDRYDEAIKEYKRALVYESRNPFLYNELAGVYYTQRLYKKSFLYSKRALKLFPGNKVFQKNLNMIPYITDSTD